MKFNRDKYLNQLIEAKENGFPKVITGIRRCGKSYLLDTIYREYLENSGVNPKNIVYIDLEDALNTEIDVVTTQSLSDEFLGKIGRDEVLIYAK